MAYIGPEPNPGQNREVDDISSGFNGSEVNFTLQVNSQNVSPGSSNNIIVSFGGVVQNPGTDYTVAASTLTFTTAPASGLSFFGLVLGQQVDIQSVADSASIVSPTLSGPTVTGDLSIADKIVHTGDTNTAIRFPAADTVTAETGGSERVRLDSSGNLALGGFTPPADLNPAVIPSLFIDSNQNTIFAESGAIYVTQNAYFNSGGSYEYVNAAAASQYRQNAGGHSFLHATSGSAGANFTFTEKLRIDSDGLKFNGDTAAANALDDYEEGYWSPTGIDGQTLHQQNSGNVACRRYIKIGKIVTCFFDINFDSGNSSANFRTRFSGLPFSKESTSEGAGGVLTISFFDGSETDMLVAHTSSANLLEFFENGDGLWSYSESAGDRVAGYITYVTA